MSIGKLKDFLVSFHRGKLIGALTTYFSLIYHISFLIVFWMLKIYPMFYFNIFSVLLFSIITIMSPRIKDFKIPYIAGYFEVIFHQLLADYYVGGETSFHFFIFLIGVLAYLVINYNLVLASVFASVSCVLFILLEIYSPKILPIYELPDSIVFTFRIINVTLAVFIIFATVLIFTYIVSHVEEGLEAQVIAKTEELEIQHQKNDKLQENIIHSLASLVENRDTDTGEHIQRTSAYVGMLSRKAFEKGIYPEIIDRNFIVMAKKAAPMHDIGKIVVPDAVLKKPGKLTNEEFSKMQLHTIEGGRIIREVIGNSEDTEYLRFAIEIATSHHERWDGKGYPKNLLGDEIPVSARIMAIADVFDALVSKRCYKDAMSEIDAFAVIKKEAGSHFDPILAQLFLENKDAIARIMRLYSK